MDGEHENRIVARLSEWFALERGIPTSAARQIRICAALHDVGKQKIPVEILNKPGKLTVQEFEIMKTHTTLGAEILRSVQGDLGVMVRETAQLHHERYDGSGYWGVSYSDLPVYVPIVSIVDVFVALVCRRVYKPAWPPNETLEYIESQIGTQFEPELARDFITLIKGDSRVPILFGERKM